MVRFFQLPAAACLIASLHSWPPEQHARLKNYCRMRLWHLQRSAQAECAQACPCHPPRQAHRQRLPHKPQLMKWVSLKNSTHLTRWPSNLLRSHATQARGHWQSMPWPSTVLSRNPAARSRPACRSRLLAQHMWFERLPQIQLASSMRLGRPDANVRVLTRPHPVQKCSINVPGPAWGWTVPERNQMTY